MSRLRKRVGGAALGAVTLFVPAIVPSPAAATGPQAIARQLAGSIPNPFEQPDAVVRVGDSLFVPDRNAVDRVGLTLPTFSILAGARTTAGAADGPAAAARFDGPKGIASDGTNLYLADTGNHTIRKVVIATGAVTTIAGSAGQVGSADGTAAAARFNQPYGIAFGGGALWITDRGNHTIRRLTPATGVVNTIAGSAGSPGAADGTGAAARFSALRAIAYNSGTVWIADDDRVRKLVPGSNVVTTLVTVTCSSSFSTVVTGLAVTGGKAYTALDCDDSDGERFTELRSIDLLTLQVAPVPHPVSNDSVGISTDGVELYVSGYGGWPPGLYRTVIGTGVTAKVGDFGESGATDGSAAAARFMGPDKLVSDGGSLFVADRGNSAVRRVSIATGQTSTLATGFEVGGIALYGPYLFVGSGNAVRRVDRVTGAVTTFATVGGSGHRVEAVVTDGSSLFLTRNDCAIYRLDPTTAALNVLAGSPSACGSVDGAGPAARFGFEAGSGPRALATDGSNLWVVDQANRRVRKVVIATAQVSTLTAFTIADELMGITAGSANVYVTTTCFGCRGAVHRISTVTGTVSTVAGKDAAVPLTFSPSTASSTLIEPQGIFADRDGRRLFVTHATGVAVIEDPATPLGIGDTTVVEGDGGTGLAVLTVRLARPMSNDVRVGYLTNDGTATAASGDYVGQSGQLTIPAGATEGRIRVTVNGDTTDETDESFKVRLVHPVGGPVLTRALGQASVLDDDPPGPVSLSIGEVTVLEGDEGSSLAVFPVRLSSAQPAPVTVAFATGNGSAIAGSDYETRSGTVSLPAGVTSATVFVKVFGDVVPEGAETFTVTLSGSSGPTITRATGTGTVPADD